MRAALYIRVSTEEQAREGFSISAQRERLSAYAMSQGWDIAGYYVDEGLSAKDMNRPELKRMIKDIENKLIDVVLVYRLDRLTRSVLDLYQLLEIFEKYNCKFKSATEVYDTTTAIGRLFITLVAALAQWERENLGERVRMGMTEKVRQGEWHGSDPPYGYDYIDGEIVINEQEAPVVKKIFEWYVSGMSDRKIAIRLNKEGVPTRSGKLWQESRIRYMLKNPMYIGSLQWGVRVNQDQYFTVDGVVPPIIDTALFEKAQKIRESRLTFHGKQATSDHVFSGILKCSRCGSSFKGHAKKDKHGTRYKSYRCRNSLIRECDMPMVSERIVEDAFLRYFKALDLKQETKSILQEQTQSEQQMKQIHDLKAELEKIKNRRKKWQYAWANDLMSDEDFKNRMKEEQQKEDEIKQRLADLNVHESIRPLDDEMIEVLSDAISNWHKLSDGEKKQLLQLAVDSVVVEKVNSTKEKDRLRILEIVFK